MKELCNRSILDGGQKKIKNHPNLFFKSEALNKKTTQRLTISWQNCNTDARIT